MAWLLVALSPRAAAAAHAPDPANGEGLAAVGPCDACHTGSGGDPYAGGHAIRTSCGTVCGTNLTPDPNAGLGRCTEADSARATRRGRDRDGHPLYPAFPYASVTHLTDDDLADLWAWPRTLPPVASRPHELHGPWRGRWLLPVWQWMGLREGPEAHVPGMPADVTRERHRVDSIGHCGECRTPRNAFGVPERGAPPQGSDDAPTGGPDLSAARLADWEAAGLMSFFADGQRPDGDTVGGEMLSVVREETSRLPDADRAAMAAYLPWDGR